MSARSLLAALALGIAACAASGARTTDPHESPVAPTPASAPTMSSPPEYAERPISAEAGASYFLETGSGDPYNAGVAYPIFLALMELFPEELAPIADKFGFLGNVDPKKSELVRDWSELADKFGFLGNVDPKAPPIGFHLTVDPNTNVPWVVGNCQLCHAERLRLPGGDVVVPGLGNKRVRIHAYANALLRIGAASKLDARAVERAATERARAWGVAWPEATRRAIVDATVDGFRKLSTERLAQAKRLDAGLPGRVATIESFAIAMGAYRKHPVAVAPTIGWAKVPDVRGFPYKETFSWDASGFGSPQALVLDADFVFGARPEWYLSHPHIATSTYLYLKSFERKLPFPKPVDAALAARGKTSFEARCAKCHGYYVEHGDAMRVSYHERVVPAAMVGTDPARADAVTQDFVDAANSIPLTRGHARVRHTGGYVPPVLLDVWARGTYGHAGQWPSLDVLATPPAERPRAFVVDPRGPYDLDRVGVRYEVGARATKPGEYAYDGEKPGYGVDGHPYLSALAPADRRAVIEYLKTLSSR